MYKYENGKLLKTVVEEVNVSEIEHEIKIQNNIIENMTHNLSEATKKRDSLVSIVAEIKIAIPDLPVFTGEIIND